MLRFASSPCTTASSPSAPSSASSSLPTIRSLPSTPFRAPPACCQLAVRRLLAACLLLASDSVRTSSFLAVRIVPRQLLTVCHLRSLLHARLPRRRARLVEAHGFLHMDPRSTFLHHSVAPPSYLLLDDPHASAGESPSYLWYCLPAVIWENWCLLTTCLWFCLPMLLVYCFVQIMFTTCLYYCLDTICACCSTSSLLDLFK